MGLEDLDGPALQEIVSVHGATGRVPTGSQALPTTPLKTLPTTLSGEVTHTWQAERGLETQGDGMTGSGVSGPTCWKAGVLHLALPFPRVAGV